MAPTSSRRSPVLELLTSRCAPGRQIRTSPAIAASSDARSGDHARGGGVMADTVTAQRSRDPSGVTLDHGSEPAGHADTAGVTPARLSALA